MEKWLASPRSICALMVLVNALGAPRARAQKPMEQEYLIRFTSNVSPYQQKFVHEGLRSQDPDALVWVNPGEQNALVRVHAHLNRSELQTAVAPCGLVIVYLGPPEGAMSQEKSLNGGSAQEPPQYKDTGDPSTDNARYETEKRAWIATYPAQYDQMNTLH